MLFKIKDGVDIFELNPELKFFPEFAKLSSMQMTTVALYADYDGPLRTKPEKDRRELAAKLGGYAMESDNKRLAVNGRNFVSGETKSMEEAINKHREIQHDETKVMIYAYDQQIHETIQLMTMDKMEAAKNDHKLAFELAEKAAKLSVKLPEIKKAKKEIQDLMNLKDNSPELTNYISSESLPEENGVLSTIDQVMAAKAK
jgi:hypothetical protein